MYSLLITDKPLFARYVHCAVTSYCCAHVQSLSAVLPASLTPVVVIVDFAKNLVCIGTQLSADQHAVWEQLAVPEPSQPF